MACGDDGLTDPSDLSPAPTPDPPAYPTPNPPEDLGEDLGEDYTCENFSLTEEEQEIYDAIMVERQKVGLPIIPVSPSLTKVARAHVLDSFHHRSAIGDCNLHSWSDQGDWTPCCYTSDHAATQCMWNKPREIAGFQGAGYEISAASWNGRLEPVGMWMGSPGHRSVMLNENGWEQPFHSIGIGYFSGENDTGVDSYSHVWFAHEPDCAP